MPRSIFDTFRHRIFIFRSSMLILLMLVLKQCTHSPTRCFESVTPFCLKGKLLRGIRNCFVYLGSKLNALCRNPSTKHVCNYNPYLDTNRNILTWIPISNLNLDIISVLNKHNITWLIYRTLRQLHSVNTILKRKGLQPVQSSIPTIQSCTNQNYRLHRFYTG